MPVPLSYRKCCRLCRGVGFLLSIPFKISNIVCKGLETVGDKFHEAPERMFKNSIKESKKRFVPGNIASGILMGTGKMLIGIAQGIGGLVYEPFKGAKENGLRGATKGFGKGILGLVCKPVAGTIDLVTLTVRGVNNMPSSMYKSALKMYKKNKEKKEKALNSINLAELEDCTPGNYALQLQDFNDDIKQNEIEENNEIIEENYKEEEDGDQREEDDNQREEESNNREEIDANEVEIIETVEFISLILERNNKLRQWILELSNYLDKEEELLYEESNEEDIFELRVQEAKQTGNKLKKKVMFLIEEFHNVHKEIGFNDETYQDYNSKIVASLKQLGLTIKDEFVIDIANMIESELLSDEEEQINIEIDLKPEKKIEKVIEVLPNPFIERAKQWKPYTSKDNYRIPEAGPKGGIPLADTKVQAQLRTVGKEVIKTIGRKVLQGDFNLTTISFPIKCMMPNTSLHNTIKSVTLGPIFYTKAALTSNPVERLKFIVAATLGTYRTTSAFLKPVILKIVKSIYWRNFNLRAWRRYTNVLWTNM